MNWIQLSRGFIALVPSLTVVIILSLIGIGLFLLGRATALNHLIKHHLKDIARDEIEELSTSNVKKQIRIEQLERENERLDTIAKGMNYVMRKGE